MCDTVSDNYQDTVMTVLEMVVTPASEDFPGPSRHKRGMNLMVPRLPQMPGSRVRQLSVDSATRVDTAFEVAGSAQEGLGLANGASR
jgi:hypothetical protein